MPVWHAKNTCLVRVDVDGFVKFFSHFDVLMCTCYYMHVADDMHYSCVRFVMNDAVSFE